MRILIIQENGRHAQNRKFRECFSLQRAFQDAGFDAVVWGLGHTNFDTRPNFNNYDIILNLENYDERGWLPCLANTRAYKILWAIDEHCRDRSYYSTIFSRDRMQLWLHSTREYATGKEHLWFPNCYDDQLIGPRGVKKRADVGFCGSMLNRAQKLDILRKHFHFVSDIWVLGDGMVEAINSYKVGWNCNLSNDINYRSFETIGCGIPLATNYNEQYTALGFEDGNNCLLYSSDDEMISKIRSLLVSDTYYQNVCSATKGLAEHHTYRRRVAELIKKLETRI